MGLPTWAQIQINMINADQWRLLNPDCVYTAGRWLDSLLPHVIVAFVNATQLICSAPSTASICYANDSVTGAYVLLRAKNCYF